MVWKKVFHGVENFGAGEGLGAEFFHGVEKSFPQYGKREFRGGWRVCIIRPGRFS